MDFASTQMTSASIPLVFRSLRGDTPEHLVEDIVYALTIAGWVIQGIVLPAGGYGPTFGHSLIGTSPQLPNMSVRVEVTCLPTDLSLDIEPCGIQCFSCTGAGTAIGFQHRLQIGTGRDGMFTSSQFQLVASCSLTFQGGTILHGKLCFADHRHRPEKLGR